MIWIIGGTSETRELVDKLPRENYIVTVATYAGVEVLKGYSVIERPMDLEQMLEFIEEFSIEQAIDMTHPYAVEVSENSKRACNESKVTYLRYVREGSAVEGATYLCDRDELDRYVSNLSGTVLFTTGIKDIARFEKLRGNNRFIYRVLPTEFSIKTCLENKVDMKDIVAMVGPFSKALNRELFRQYGAAYVVMKDSGIRGGTREKLDACREIGIAPIVIGRKGEDGLSNIEEILEMVR